MMSLIEVISFDAEGTLVTPDFSHTMWHEAIPAVYAESKRLEITQAKKLVCIEYDKIGDQKLEWYDINYWFRYLKLGNPETVIQRCLDKLCYYPEVTEILSSLSKQYKLIVASGTPLELLHYLLRDIEPYFSHVFSSTSHYRQLKTPDFYRGICKDMDIQPRQVVHIGDNWQFDFINPNQVGINALYLDRSGTNHKESLTNLTQLKQHLSTQL